MTAPWHELTPRAREAMWMEVEALLTRVPNQAAVPVMLGWLVKHPELVPSAIEAIRVRLNERHA